MQAFSENKDGVITHSTNGPSARKLLKLPETKDNVPIDVYLQKVFPRSSLIPMKVDGRYAFVNPFACSNGKGTRTDSRAHLFWRVREGWWRERTPTRTT